MSVAHSKVLWRPPKLAIACIHSYLPILRFRFILETYQECDVSIHACTYSYCNIRVIINLSNFRVNVEINEEHEYNVIRRDQHIDHHDQHNEVRIFLSTYPMQSTSHSF